MLGRQLQGKESSQSLSLPSERSAAAAQGIPVEIFPSLRQRGGRAAAELSLGWRPLPGGSSAAASTTLQSLRCPSPSPTRGHLDNVGRAGCLRAQRPAVAQHPPRVPRSTVGVRVRVVVVVGEKSRGSPLAAVPGQRAPEARPRLRGTSGERVLRSPTHSRFPGPPARPPARPLLSRLRLGARPLVRPPHHPARSRTRTPRPAALGAVMAARSSFRRHRGSPARRGPAIRVAVASSATAAGPSRGVARARRSCFCKG